MLTQGCSNLVSVIFPIFGTYKSFESYNKVANDIAASNVSIGGFQVPINALLRKSSETTNDSGSSEQRLQRHLISMQKWMVYWIVYASLNTAESVLLLRYIVPMYSLIRLGVSIWLVAPMITGIPSDEAEVNIAAARKKEFIQFLESGCGLCYYRFIKPCLNGEYKLPGGVDLTQIVSPSILEYLNQYELIRYVTSQLNLGKTNNAHPEGSLFDVVKSKVIDTSSSYLFVNNFFSDKATSLSTVDKATDKDAKVPKELTAVKSSLVHVYDDEYDVVDKPGILEISDDTATISEPKIEKRKGWIW